MRRALRSSILVAAGLVCLSAAARAQAPEDAADVDAGRALYEQKCAQCHGAEGDGAGVANSRLSPVPRDFTSGSFKIRTTPSGELPTDADLADIIRRGMPGTAMPGWSSLSEAEIVGLVAYIKTFNEDFADPEMLVPSIEIPAPPPASAESLRRGRDVYLANKCHDCHGDQGRGDGPSAPTLSDDAGRPIRAADLTKRWDFRGGSGREDIYRTFTTGLDGTPMPSYADSIGEQERWQLVDYVYSLSRDEPGYGTLVVASRVDAEIAVDPTSDLFSSAAATAFPLVGQITDPGRRFAPSTRDLEVRAIYNDDVIALQLSWSAMEPGREGGNRPDGRDAADSAPLADAVAVQLPSELPDGPARPYFLYGDVANSVDLWFYDAAKDAPEVYRGKGEASLVPGPDRGIRARGHFEHGLWRVAFVAPRGGADEPHFPESTFIPVAFSVWAGPAGETGNRRAVTGWYSLYLAPPEGGGAYVAAGGLFLLTLFAELALSAGVRRSRRVDNSHGAGVTDPLR